MMGSLFFFFSYPNRSASFFATQPPQAHHVSNFSGSSKNTRKRRCSLPIERAIQDYLEDQKRHHRGKKTLEWHQTALGLLRDYLLIECHVTLLRQITQKEIQS
jgi:hypothetical protein